MILNIFFSSGLGWDNLPARVKTNQRLLRIAESEGAKLRSLPDYQVQHDCTPGPFRPVYRSRWRWYATLPKSLRS